jgi:formamidopyrimidine-DNA glycosylase
VPELPEIETLTLQLRPAMAGRAVVGVSTRQPRALNLPLDEFIERASGPVLGVRRIGKSVVIEVPQGHVWIHLGVNGQLLLDRDGTVADPVVRITLDDGTSLVLERIFMGHAHFYDGDESGRRALNAGLDPLTEAFGPEAIHALLQKRPRQAIKNILMDQAAIAGVGNAYADEILCAAGIHPLRPAGSLSAEEIEALCKEGRGVLERAVSLGGDNDYTDLYGARGRSFTMVHSQSICQRCQAPVQQIKTGGRTTYFCPSCQPAL